MTAEEINAILDRLKMRQMDLAVLASVTARSVNNWTSGRWPVPRPIAILLRAIDQNHIPDDWLFDQVRTT